MKTRDLKKEYEIIRKALKSSKDHILKDLLRKQLTILAVEIDKKKVRAKK